MTPKLVALVAAASAVIAVPLTASAADKPAPCQDKPQVTDPAGDAFVGFVGLFETPIPAGPNVDVTALFINSRDGKTTFNIQVDNLDKTVGSGATANVYRLNYGVGDATNYLQARVDSTGVAYSYGHSDTTGLVKDGDAKGAFHEGKDGVIEIEVPASHGGKPGTKWVDASLFTAYVRQSVNTQTDEAPDAATFNYNGAECAAGGPTGTPGPTGSPTPGATPTPTASPTPTPPAGPLKITAAPTTIKAKKVKKAKKVGFTLRPSETMTKLKIALKRGSKTLGKTKLATLQGAKTVVLKLKKKGLKKGRYTLAVTATRSDGSTGSAAIAVRVK